MLLRRRRATFEEWASLPLGTRAEFLDGELVMAPSPDGSHQRLAMRIAFALGAHLGAEGAERVYAAPLDVFLAGRNVAQPDVLVLPEGTKPQPPPWKIPLPVVVFEVVSPRGQECDVERKLPLYARSGIREAWIVDQFRKVVEVHDLAAGAHAAYGPGETARSGAIPGFALEVARLLES
ncbi:MAG TPA: Uma2 family endonuclease [Planctomycetota bacterium]|nr:Uma2 family endonuclease [Planctomycetota bacterium]